MPAWVKERLGRPADQLIDDLGCGQELVDEGGPLAGVQRQRLHVAAGPMHGGRRVVAMDVAAVGRLRQPVALTGRPGAAGRPARSHAANVLLQSTRCGASGQPPSKAVVYAVLVSRASRRRRRHS